MEGFVVHEIPNWFEKTLFMHKGQACALEQGASDWILIFGWTYPLKLSHDSPNTQDKQVIVA